MNTLELSYVSRTVTVILPATKETVFSFLSQIENLPAWATEFCSEVKREGAHHKVVTSSGELFFRIESDSETGVIDMFSGPTPTEQSIFPCRVIALPGQGSAVSFTFFRPADMTPDTFDQVYQSLLIEMEGLVQRFSR
jgi:hypothetical protein